VGSEKRKDKQRKTGKMILAIWCSERPLWTSMTMDRKKGKEIK
jgi:hypothetical protein